MDNATEFLEYAQDLLTVFGIQDREVTLSGDILVIKPEADRAAAKLIGSQGKTLHAVQRVLSAAGRAILGRKVLVVAETRGAR